MSHGGYLLDTSSLSLLAPGRSTLPEAVLARLREETEHLHLSVVTLAEIRERICKLRRKGAMARAEALDAWVTSLTALFADRLLAFGRAEADESGALSDWAAGIGRHPGFADRGHRKGAPPHPRHREPPSLRTADAVRRDGPESCRDDLMPLYGAGR